MILTQEQIEIECKRMQLLAELEALRPAWVKAYKGHFNPILFCDISFPWCLPEDEM